MATGGTKKIKSWSPWLQMWTRRPRRSSHFTTGPRAKLGTCPRATLSVPRHCTDGGFLGLPPLFQPVCGADASARRDDSEKQESSRVAWYVHWTRIASALGYVCAPSSHCRSAQARRSTSAKGSDVSLYFSPMVVFRRTRPRQLRFIAKFALAGGHPHAIKVSPRERGSLIVVRRSPRVEETGTDCRWGCLPGTHPIAHSGTDQDVQYHQFGSSRCGKCDSNIASVGTSTAMQAEEFWSLDRQLLQLVGQRRDRVLRLPFRLSSALITTCADVHRNSAIASATTALSNGLGHHLAARSW